MDKALEIVLVEDNADDEELILHALHKYHLANRIHVVRDGAEALDLLLPTDNDAVHKSELKLILLDLKLPKIDGLEVLRHLKNDPRTKTIPVVVLTSSASEQDIIKSYQLGVNGYVTKPIDFAQFSEAVYQLGLYWLVVNQKPHYQ
ncbi:MAG: response regulator [Caldilineaceae bacterium]